MESRNSYGWGYIGATKEGFEWLITYDEEKRKNQRYRSGYVYDTERQAINAGRNFQKRCTYDPIKNGKLTAIKAEPLHFEY